MTTRAEFAQDEWDSLVQLPRFVVAAASASQRDLVHRTKIEVEAGLIATAHGRFHGNDFVAEVGGDTLRIFDNPAVAGAVEFTNSESGILDVLARARTVNRMLNAKASVTDAMAYRGWLLAITDVVISAARTGDFLGFGGKVITPLEQHFRDRLVVVLQS